MPSIALTRFGAGIWANVAPPKVMRNVEIAERRMMDGGVCLKSGRCAIDVQETGGLDSNKGVRYGKTEKGVLIRGT
jgi:hypothetical protein